jgi:hypothetical protein
MVPVCFTTVSSLSFSSRIRFVFASESTSNGDAVLAIVIVSLSSIEAISGSGVSDVSTLSANVAILQDSGAVTRSRSRAYLGICCLQGTFVVSAYGKRISRRRGFQLLGVPDRRQRELAHPIVAQVDILRTSLSVSPRSAALSTWPA